MSRLPEPGDVRRASDLLDARVRAVSGCDHVEASPVMMVGGHLRGEGADPIFACYGDLFDPGEFLAEIGFLLISATRADLLASGDVQSSLATLVLQSAALGALMERQRWTT